ncbi:MAG: hypothetical protein K5829_12680 [Treponema sp.]|nr:hypothetical protein [Treponema sp.]
MIVIIAHIEAELLFYKFQKEILKNLNSQQSLFYALSPLWIPLPEEAEKYFTNLKRDAKKIESVIIEEATLCENEIFSNVKIRIQGKEYISRLTLCKSLKNKALSTKIEESAIIKFPYKLKIFRLGQKEEVSPNTQALTQSVWIKLPS